MENGILIIVSIILITIFVSYYFSPKRRLMATIKKNSKAQEWQKMLVNIYRWLKLKDSSREAYSLKILMREDKNKELCRQILSLQHAIIHETNFNPERLFEELKKFPNI